MAKAPTASSSSSNPKRPSRRRQAVVVVHGMGEQMPMETLQSFVDSVWSRDRDIKARTDEDQEDFGEDNPTWFKPEVYSGGFELRRIATRRYEAGQDNSGNPIYGPRTDFFEFYWADVMQGTNWTHFTDWLKTLLFRWPTQVPFGVFWAWLVLWAASIFIFLLGLEYGSSSLNTLLGEDSAFAAYLPLNLFGAWTDWAGRSAALLGVIWFFWRSFLKQGFLVSYLGDVARYVRAQPANIGKRHTIRSKGVDFLRKLNDEGPYKRIIVVAHSLGSIIAYDLLSYLWAEYNENFGGAENSANLKALRDLEKAARTLNKSPTKANRTRYRKLQRAYLARISRHGDASWVISDFVTLGSPLTHGDFLMARTHEIFRDHVKRRTYPQCPPQMEKIRLKPGQKPTSAFTYFWARKGNQRLWVPHHATVFAPVRWTNIHCRHWFTNLLIFPGDLVSGKVGPLFGKGIVDLRVWMWHWAALFTHTSYWTWKKSFSADSPPDHIRLLRAAVNVRDEGDPVMDWVED